MKKLTKEQADWLINKLSQYCFMAPIMNDVEMSVTRADLLKLLNQCTEKEFPEFELNDDGEIVRLLGNVEHGKVCIEVPDGIIGISFERFKAFTQGCVKIVEYLDEET